MPRMPMKYVASSTGMFSLPHGCGDAPSPQDGEGSSPSAGAQTPPAEGNHCPPMRSQVQSPPQHSRGAGVEAYPCRSPDPLLTPKPGTGSHRLETTPSPARQSTMLPQGNTGLPMTPLGQGRRDFSLPRDSPHPSGQHWVAAFWSVGTCPSPDIERTPQGLPSCAPNFVLSTADRQALFM